MIPPKAFFGSAKAHLLRLWIPELGAVRLDNDPDGSRRAAWIRKVLALLRANSAAAVSWWCGMGSSGKNIHLADTPSKTAWLDALAGRA